MVSDMTETTTKVKTCVGSTFLRKCYNKNIL